MHDDDKDLPAKARTVDAHGVEINEAPLWYPDFRVNLPAAAFPSFWRTVARIAAFVADHSGGAVLDLHQLPISG